MNKKTSLHRPHFTLMVLVFLLFLFSGSSAFGAISGSETSFNLSAHALVVSSAFGFPPPGVVAYVPITLTNSQNQGTGSPFQEQINVDWQEYTPYVNSQCSNVEFYTFNWNVLDAWMQNASSTCSSDHNDVVWVKLPSGIGASSRIEVNLAFFSISTNNFNSEGPWGEAAYIYNPNQANYSTSYEQLHMGKYGVTFNSATKLYGEQAILNNPFGNGTSFQIYGTAPAYNTWTDYLAKSAGWYQWTKANGGSPVLSNTTAGFPTHGTTNTYYPYVDNVYEYPNGTMLVLGHSTSTPYCSGTADPEQCELWMFKTTDLIHYTFLGDITGTDGVRNLNGSIYSNPHLAIYNGQYILAVSNNSQNAPLDSLGGVSLFVSSNLLSGYTKLGNINCASMGNPSWCSGKTISDGNLYYDASTGYYRLFMTNYGHDIGTCYTKTPVTFSSWTCLSTPIISDSSVSFSGRVGFIYSGNTEYLFTDTSGVQTLYQSYSYNSVDDGAQVFDYYTNFTSSEGWSAGSSGSTTGVIFNNGLTLNPQGAYTDWAFQSYTPSSEEQSNGLYFDIGGIINNITTSTSGSPAILGLGNGANSSTFLPNGYLGKMFALGNTQDNIQRVVSSSATTLTSTSDSGTDYLPVTLRFGWSGSNLQLDANNKVTLTATDSTYSLSSSVSQMIISSSNAASGKASDMSATYYWADTRIYPPNNVMPSFTFGSISIMHRF